MTATELVECYLAVTREPEGKFHVSTDGRGRPLMLVIDEKMVDRMESDKDLQSRLCGWKCPVVLTIPAAKKLFSAGR